VTSHFQKRKVEFAFVFHRWDYLNLVCSLLVCRFYWTQSTSLGCVAVETQSTSLGCIAYGDGRTIASASLFPCHSLSYTSSNGQQLGVPTGPRPHGHVHWWLVGVVVSCNPITILVANWGATCFSCNKINSLIVIMGHVHWWLPMLPSSLEHYPFHQAGTAMQARAARLRAHKEEGPPLGTQDAAPIWHGNGTRC
jgi:hypothetical protein